MEDDRKKQVAKTLDNEVDQANVQLAISEFASSLDQDEKTSPVFIIPCNT